MNFTPLNNTRLDFKIRSKMVENIPGNFKNKYRRGKKSCDQDEGLICPHCWNGQQLMQMHLLLCSEWTDIREVINMYSISCLFYFILFYFSC